MQAEIPHYKTCKSRNLNKIVFQARDDTNLGQGRFTRFPFRTGILFLLKTGTEKNFGRAAVLKFGTTSPL